MTRAFSDLGWTGINIEPSVEFYSRLAAARGRDTNLRVAVGCEPGSATFFEIPALDYPHLTRKSRRPTVRLVGLSTRRQSSRSPLRKSAGGVRAG